MERNGIHIIDLYKTAAKLDEAAAALKSIAKAGKKVLFVATKKQAKQVVADKAQSIAMPYVIERWPGGMLTNFPTIRKAVKKMASIDKMTKDGTFDNLSKREKLQITRQRAKLEKTLGSIADLNRLPSALFVVDVKLTASASPCSLSLTPTLTPTTLTSLSPLTTTLQSQSSSSSTPFAQLWLKVSKSARLRKLTTRLQAKAKLHPSVTAAALTARLKTLKKLLKLPLLNNQHSSKNPLSPLSFLLTSTYKNLPIWQ